MSLFEIVPNLSEGRDASVVDACVEAVHACGARVLHRTSDAAHNRSVLTIAGDAQTVKSAALALAKTAHERIDLRSHAGVHPRIGALDVLPFVPLEGASMDEAVELARECAQAIWGELGIPTFLYGEAARDDRRRLLATVRAGQFEGLDARFADEAWRPDFGDVAKHPTAGAVAVGARPLLIAFNVELDSADLNVARRIARAIRERDGGFGTLRALGLRLRPDCVQVSLNITDYRATPLYRVVETIRLLAAGEGVCVAGAELIGCLPQEAVFACARDYLACEPAEAVSALR